jgi:CRISPR-associated protein Cas1
MSRQLLNTLFVTTPGAFVRLDGDTVRVDADGTKLLQVPLLHLGQLVLFGGASISPPLMCRCAEEDREVTFLDFAGRFKCRVVGPTSGNVLLRKAQYDAQADEARTLEIARPIVAGKIKNSRQTLLRAARDVRAEDQKSVLNEQAAFMAVHLQTLPDMTSLDGVRGIEGQAASCYFQAFGSMITREKAEFAFATRTRRPPRDRVNALLSFVYALLTTDCVAAVEGVGMDPQFGFLHCLRPGRPALALDLMEEFRSYLADRLVLTLINRKQIQPDHFESRPGESVLLTAEGRKVVLSAYQARKQEEIAHPLLQTKTPVGLVPHLQARLLARHLRGDLPSYIPFVAR